MGAFFVAPKWGFKVSDNQNNSNAKPEGGNTGPEVNGDGQAIDHKADAEKWKTLSRKNETELEKVRKELEQARASQMTDAEKALSDAKAEGRKAALAEYGTKLAEAEIKSAAASQQRTVPDGLRDFLNLNAFVGEDGSPNADAITAFVTSLPTAAPGPPAFDQNVGIGPQGGTGASQLSRADMARMTPQQIVKARSEGRFDALLNGNL